MELLISLIGGIIGSNATGKILKDFDQGSMFNSIIGIIGGAVGEQILTTVTAGSIDISSSQGINILSLILSGAAGGSLLLSIVGIIKNISSR